MYYKHRSVQFCFVIFGLVLMHAAIVPIHVIGRIYIYVNMTPKYEFIV